MSDHRNQLIAICDMLDFYQSELTSLACQLEDIGRPIPADKIRHTVGDLENITSHLRYRRKENNHG